ncbi:MAG: MFS transporter [Acidimicrobiales bacterium]|nr:MFS transporter [Acidimicrobiales bacterium]
MTTDDPTAATGVDALEARPAPADGVWAPARRRLTAALVLTITLVAFESLAIATVMPVVSDDLGGLGLYGWVFSGFFLGSLLGIVLAGRAADRRGTRAPFAAGLVLFTIGLIVGGAAQSMGMLVAGRVAQGIGAGVIPAVAYATVARSYPPALRPRVFAVFSSAWVVPGLIGPAAASAIEHAVSWRVVFLALLPFVVIAAALALPVLSDRVPATGTAGERPDGDPSAGDAEVGDSEVPAEPGTEVPAEAPAPAGDDRRRDALVLVAGVALVLGGLGAHQLWLAVALVVVGALPAVWAFVRLVPEGTVRLHPGLPAAVAARGILTFAFFGTDAYVSLAVTDAHDADTWVAGLALTGATLAWTTGAWVQQRLVVQHGPRWLVRRGMAILAVGIAAMIVALGSVPVGVTVLAWTIGGLGMGLSYAPISVTVLGTAAPGEEGRASASLQLTDVLGVALGTGLAGVFVALGDGRDWATGSSLTIAFVITLAVAVGGVLAAGRLPRRLPGVED